MTGTHYLGLRKGTGKKQPALMFPRLGRNFFKIKVIGVFCDVSATVRRSLS